MDQQEKKGRTYEQFAGSDYYANKNDELKQLYLERMQRLNQQKLDQSEKSDQQVLKRILTISDDNEEQKLNKSKKSQQNTVIIIDNDDSNVAIQKNSPSNITKSSTKDLPLKQKSIAQGSSNTKNLELEKDNLNYSFYINHLIHYPKETRKSYMTSFRDMFFENTEEYQKHMQTKVTNVKSIFMTSFGYSTDLFEKLLEQKIPIILSNDWEKHSKYIPIIKNFCDYPNFTLLQTYKIMNYSAFHPKLWLIEFPTFLRVVVGSGNLNEED